MDGRTRAGKIAKLGQEIIDNGGTQIEAIAVMIDYATAKKKKDKEELKPPVNPRDVLNIIRENVELIDTSITPNSSFAVLSRHLISVNATLDGVNTLAQWINNGGLSWWTYGKPTWLTFVKHFVNWYARAHSEELIEEDDIGGKVR